MSRLTVTLGISSLLLPLGGCWFSLGESGTRASSIDVTSLHPIVWPERETHDVYAIADDTPAEIFEWKIVDESIAEAESAEAANVARYQIRASLLTDHGLLRVFDERFASDTDRLFAGLFEGFAANARFLSSYTLAPPEEVEEWMTSRRRSSFIMAGPGIEPVMDIYTLQMRDGTDLLVPDPAQRANPRGIVLHLRGMVSTSYEEAFVDQIVDSDWLVVRIGTHTSIATHRDALRNEREGQRAARRQQLIDEYRATLDPDDPRSAYAPVPMQQIFLQVQLELPDIPPGFMLENREQIHSVGRAIARAVDDALAENAYAAEAAIAYLDREYPHLSGLPVAVLGCSAGAISAPAVAARLRERFGDRLSALVLIGGGADIMRIDRHTSLQAGNRLGVYRSGDLPVSGREWDAINAAYLDSVRLDPLVLGPRLRDVPTLIIRAGFDKWVPASTGSELVRAFGKPDRDWHPGGHQTLFYFLEGRAPRVLRWLDHNTPRSISPATVAP